MSLKYSSTTADYLIWSDAMNLIRKLAKDDNPKIRKQSQWQSQLQ